MMTGLVALLVGCSSPRASVIGPSDEDADVKADAAPPSPHERDGATPAIDAGHGDSGPPVEHDAGKRDAGDPDSGVRQDASNGEPTCTQPSGAMVGAQIVFHVVNQLGMPIFLAHTPPTYCTPHLWLVPCDGGERITWQPAVDLCDCQRCESSCELCTPDQCSTERCDTENVALPAGASVEIPWMAQEHIEGSSACAAAPVCATSRAVPAGDYVLSVPVHADAASAARNAAFRIFELPVHLPPEGGSVYVELKP
jgi:hypothetical protein